MEWAGRACTSCIGAGILGWSAARSLPAFLTRQRRAAARSRARGHLKALYRCSSRPRGATRENKGGEDGQGTCLLTKGRERRQQHLSVVLFPNSRDEFFSARSSAPDVVQASVLSRMWRGTVQDGGVWTWKTGIRENEEEAGE